MLGHSATEMFAQTHQELRASDGSEVPGGPGGEVQNCTGEGVQEV